MTQHIFAFQPMSRASNWERLRQGEDDLSGFCGGLAEVTRDAELLDLPMFLLQFLKVKTSEHESFGLGGCIWMIWDADT